MAKSLQEGSRVRGAAQRERRQSQHGNPASCAFLQRHRALACRFIAQHPCEKSLHLLQRKAQVGTAQFGELAQGQPFDQRQRRIEARSQHQVQLGRQIPD